jgi:hypothetical protein
MKGLIAEIFRGGYDSVLNEMHNKTKVTIIDSEIDKIFEADDEAPAVRIVKRQFSGYIYIHAEPMDTTKNYQFGGTYISSSDSRISALNKYPIPLHDRVEN